VRNDLPDVDRRRRTSADELRQWLPIVLSLVTTILMLGVIYGKLDGRLVLIEYRLGNIERHIMP